MHRDGGDGPRGNDTIGIIITVLSAVLLGFVLVQIYRLGNEAGLSRDSLMREQVAVTETGRILSAISAIDDYRYNLMLRTPQIESARANVQAHLDGLRRDFSTGSAAMFSMHPQWDNVERNWEIGQHAARRTRHDRAHESAMGAVAGLLDALEDRSGLTYDPSPLAQDLADAYMQMSIANISATRRLQTVASSAVQTQGMTLAQRLDGAGNLMNLRESYDLTHDHIPTNVERLDALVPDQRAQWSQLPALVDRMRIRGNAFVDMVVNKVMLQPKPMVSLAYIRQGARRCDGGGGTSQCAHRHCTQCEPSSARPYRGITQPVPLPRVRARRNPGRWHRDDDCRVHCATRSRLATRCAA